MSLRASCVAPLSLGTVGRGEAKATVGGGTFGEYFGGRTGKGGSRSVAGKPTRRAMRGTVLPRGEERARADKGLTIVEVIVALSIVMLAAVTLAMVLTNGVLAVSLSEQSQAASNLAASVVAQAESLPWATLEQGLSSTDPNLVVDEASGGNVGVAITPGYYCYEGMPLFVSSGGASPLASATTPPLCPPAGLQGGPQWPWQSPSWPTGACYASLAAEIAASPSADVPLASHAACVSVDHTNFTVVVYPTVAPGSVYPPAEVEVSVVVTWPGSTSSSTGRTRVTNTVVLTQCRVSSNNGSCPQ